MNLIYIDTYYDQEGYDEVVDENKFLDETKNELKKFDDSLHVRHTDLGHGADQPAVLVELFKSVDWKALLAASTIGLFFLGDKINKNIDAWKEIFQKFAELMRKHGPDRIDDNAALVLVINDLLSKDYEVGVIELSMQVLVYDKNHHNTEWHETKPEALYVVHARVPEKIFIYGIRSHGNIEFMHEFNTNWF